MKNLIPTLSLTILLIGTTLISCKTPAAKEDKAEDKVHKAEINLEEAQVDLVNVRLDTITSYQKFVNESEIMINEYEKRHCRIKNENCHREK